MDEVMATPPKAMVTSFPPSPLNAFFAIRRRLPAMKPEKKIKLRFPATEGAVIPIKAPQ